MMKSTTLCWGLVLFVLFTQMSLGNAQNSQLELRNNRSVLRYFNGNDLVELQNVAPGKYHVLSEYFTNSFTVELASEEPGAINEVAFYNYDLFNVVEHEHLREPLNDVTFLFKEKYLITLRSQQWLDSELNGLSPQEILQISLPRPLPQWVSSGNTAEDYAVYKKCLEAWIRDFTEDYRQITSENLVPKIRIAEWNQFSQDKIEYYLNLPNGYIIVD